MNENTKIRDADFSVRAKCSLLSHNIKTLGELSKFTDRQLLRTVRNFGLKSLMEVQDILRENGMCLRSDEAFEVMLEETLKGVELSLRQFHRQGRL